MFEFQIFPWTCKNPRDQASNGSMKPYILPLLCLSLMSNLFAEVPGSATEAKPLGEGKTAPNVEFHTVDGEKTDLNTVRDGQPVVLVFYRGGWCPYCNRHLSELQAVEDDLKDKGWKIVAVSPDRPEKLRESLKELEVDYTLLSDSDMSAAQAFGVAFQVDPPTVKKLESYKIDLVAASGKPHRQLPVPSVFLIDREGRIVYAYSNPDYKTRLSAGKLMEQVNAAAN